MLSDTEHHSRARDILSTRILLAPWSLSPLASIFRASSRVAQLVEQPAVNRRVAGSSPASGASLQTAFIPALSLNRTHGRAATLCGRRRQLHDLEPVAAQHVHRLHQP